jgi:hypothetical protein
VLAEHLLTDPHPHPTRRRRASVSRATYTKESALTTAAGPGPSDRRSKHVRVPDRTGRRGRPARVPRRPGCRGSAGRRTLPSIRRPALRRGHRPPEAVPAAGIVERPAQDCVGRVRSVELDGDELLSWRANGCVTPEVGRRRWGGASGRLVVPVIRSVAASPGDRSKPPTDADFRPAACRTRRRRQLID